MHRLRLVIFWCIVLAVSAAGKKGKKPQVLIDESVLPELTDVLDEVGLNETQIAAMQLRGVDRTRQLLKWRRSDVQLLSELGVSAETGEVLLEKISALKKLAIKEAGPDTGIDALTLMRQERAGISYGRLYVNRSTATFEYKQAWFGARTAPETWFNLIKALPSDACSPLDNQTYQNAIILADRGGCTFVEKAWNAQRAGAAVLAVINEPNKSFDRPASGYATDEIETPTPDTLFVALLEAHAAAALQFVAAAPLMKNTLEQRKVCKAAQRAQQRGYTPDDATQARFIPLKCQPGQPSCRPVLPEETQLVPDTDSGYLYTENNAYFEYVAGAWGSVPPVKPLRLVRAVPPDLCAPPPNWACKKLGLFCPLPKVSKFAKDAVASAVLADRGNCNFSVKTAFADSVSAAVLIVADSSGQPLQRMGLRAPRLPPALSGLLIDQNSAASLLEILDTSQHPPHIRIATDYPGFAAMWLKLVEILPWPADPDTAQLHYRRALRDHLDSIARQRWLNSSFAEHMANLTGTSTTCSTISSAEGACLPSLPDTKID